VKLPLPFLTKFLLPLLILFLRGVRFKSQLIHACFQFVVAVAFQEPIDRECCFLFYLPLAVDILWWCLKTR
jgi:hypothetical protein